MLRTCDWQLVIDVSRQFIGPIYMGQAVQAECREGTILKYSAINYYTIAKKQTSFTMNVCGVPDTNLQESHSNERLTSYVWGPRDARK